MRTLLTILGLLALTGTALSQTTSLNTEALTRIEADNDAHVIRFIVNGNEVGRLTERGLEIVNSIIYGRTMRGRGPIPMTPEGIEVINAP